MKALVNRGSGEPAVEIQDVPEPHPAPNEAVVGVEAVAINRGELRLLAARGAGWRPGQDVAGVVLQQAADGSGPPPGERVVAWPEQQGWAEQLAVPTTHLAVLDPRVSFSEAATLPVAGITALRLLRIGGDRRGRRVLVTGAAGGVGRFAVELAAGSGASVTGVVADDRRGAGLEDLGAHRVVHDPDEAEGPFDLILESVGGHSLESAIGLVAPGGTIAVFGNSSNSPATISFANFRGHAGARIEAFFVYESGEPPGFGEDLQMLADLVAAGELHPQVGIEASWSEANSVFQALANRQVNGKAVLLIDDLPSFVATAEGVNIFVLATATDPGVSDDARGSPGESDGYRIWLYNRDGEDTPIDWDGGPLPDPGDDELLWVDVDLDSVDRLAEVWEGLGVAGIVTSLDQGDQAELAQHDDLVQLQVTTLGEGALSEPMALHCLVGTNWIATLHRGELNLVDDFNKPFHGETYLGGLDGPAFLSIVLDWQLGAYFDAIEEVQSEIDQLDERLLAESAHDVTEEVTILQELQALRRRVRQIRRELSSQRELFERLSHPESDAVIGSKYAPDFQRLSDRLQQAIDGLDNLREMIVGSFEMFMTRTAQATNDIMKRLTIISVLLLPAAVIAGIMGMNFKVGFFETTWMFWVVIASMLLLAVITLVVAKRNRWL